MKILSIQILRGGAAWLVVVHHFMQQFYNFQDTNFIGNFFSNYGQFGVDIFFVISGFIMTFILSNTKTDAKGFFLNRIIRIVPNYWFWTIIIVIMGFFIKDLHSSDANLLSILMSLLFIPHENPSQLLGVYPTLSVGWTLNLEMFFYVLLSFILLFKFSSKSNILLMVGILILLPVVYKIFNIEFYKYVAGNLKLFEFGLGIVLYYIRDKYIVFFNSKYMIITFLIFLLISFMKIGAMKYIVLAGFIVYIALRMEELIHSYRYNLIINFFVYLGEISYSTYLSHGIVLSLVYFNFVGTVHNTYLFLSYILITILLSIMSYKIIEINFPLLLKIRKAQ